MPHTTVNEIVNYLYAESKLPPARAAFDFAHHMYYFSKGHEHSRYNHEYAEYVINVLSALSGISDMPEEYWKAIDRYFACSDMSGYNCTTPKARYIAAIREWTQKYMEEYKSLCERTEETRRIINHSQCLFFKDPQNSIVVDYIKYIENYNPGYPKSLFYGSLFNIGFMQGIRAERARLRGTPIPPHERTKAAAYQGRKHKRRYVSEM